MGPPLIGEARADLIRTRRSQLLFQERCEPEYAKSAPLWLEHVDTEYESRVHQSFFPACEDCKPSSNYFTLGDNLFRSDDSYATETSTELY